MSTHIGSAVALKEQARSYIFPGGDRVDLVDVVELVVRESGTHRLKTADGKLHIIPTGWIHIEVTAQDWTV